MAEHEADPEEDDMRETRTITGASSRTSSPIAIPQPRPAPPRETRTTPSGSPAVIDLREIPSGPANDSVPEPFPTRRGLRGLVTRLLGERPLTAEERAHSAAALDSYRSLHDQVLTASVQLRHGLR